MSDATKGDIKYIRQDLYDEALARINELREECEGLEGQLENVSKQYAETHEAYMDNLADSEKELVELVSLREKYEGIQAHANGLQYSFDCKQKEVTKLEQKLDTLAGIEGVAIAERMELKRVIARNSLLEAALTHVEDILRIIYHTSEGKIRADAHACAAKVSEALAGGEL